MMRRWRLPPLPPGDDVPLAVVWTCLAVATLSAAVSPSLSPQLAAERGKNPNIEQPRRRPLAPHAGNPCGQRWKIIPDTRSHRGFFF